MQNVVPLDRPVKAFSVPLDKLDGYEGVKMLSKMMREWERSSKVNTYKILAKKAGLWPETVSRIASRETKAPRLHTVLMLFKALGFVAVRFE